MSQIVFKCPTCGSRLFCAQAQERADVVKRLRYCKECRGVFRTLETVEKEIIPDALIREQLARKGLDIA
jgi:transcriptional regulator NrdR family protein